MLASTISSASFSISSFGIVIGVRGKAVRPVRDDSNIPNGAINVMNESIRAGFAELGIRVRSETGLGVFGPAYTSTIQLFVLISRILPPNRWVILVI